MSTKADNWAQLQMAKILVILKQLLTIRIVNFAKTLFFAKIHIGGRKSNRLTDEKAKRLEGSQPFV